MELGADGTSNRQSSRISCGSNGAVTEFYKLLSYKGDANLETKLGEWENFYNFHRPLGAHHGKAPYQALREKL